MVFQNFAKPIAADKKAPAAAVKNTNIKKSGVMTGLKK
jgi:hypothetical protein